MEIFRFEKFLRNVQQMVDRIMYIHNNINMIILLLVFVTPVLVDSATELPAWHMKPLGSHVPPESVDETFPHDMITPEDFANKYVVPRKPLVFRDVVKDWPAYKMWTDEYLTEKYGDLELRLEAKKEKQGRIPKGDVCLGRDRMKTFLNEYNKGADKYVVSELPTPMWHEVFVPPPMTCGEFLTSYVEIDLWINSDTGKKGKGGNSILHKDAFNTVNCVANGSKEWKLIELKYNDYVYQSWEGPLDAGYGGFSLINPEKVDAKEFPNVGKIPRWQFVTINTGDCIYLPSQMWHQVKSYGATNRAVAFLFDQFNEKKSLNTTGCEGPRKLALSDVDVDLQYPGNGIMTMGHMPIEATRERLMEMIDEETGLITPKSVYRLVYYGHAGGAINKKVIKEKAKALYLHIKSIAGNQKDKMTADIVEKMTRDQIRYTYNLIHIIEPSNTYTQEYSVILPEEIVHLIAQLQATNDGKLVKAEFLRAYEEVLYGTPEFGEKLWQQLAGDNEIVDDVTDDTVTKAVRLYEYYRRDKPEDDAGENDTITTPQGHVSQPKKRRGGYSGAEREEESEENTNENYERDDDEDAGKEDDSKENGDEENKNNGQHSKDEL